jgi:type II secretory pathway predicted ATPase ExeA
MSKTQTPDIRGHFGFTALPFTREVTVSEQWRTPLFDEPLGELHAVLEKRMSAALLAPAGAGKTALLRALIARLPEARYRVHYFKVTALGKRDLCREIAHGVGLDPAGTYPGLVRQLQDRFEASLRTDARRPVLLVDEAHDLRPDVAPIFRLLTNFEMDSRLVLSVLLCGQPPLKKLLVRQDVEAFTQRLALIASLRLLSRTETRQYVEHRLRTVGCKKPPFDEPALDAIYEVSRGNLRAIDHAVLGALELAAARSVPTIDPALVAEARQRLVP